MGISNEADAALFADTAPYADGYIPVDDGKHRLHYQEYGDPFGIPVIYCHGGPGYGIDDFVHRYFDPTKYRIITFDQRGAHRSLGPNGTMEDLHLASITSRAMVEDIEAVAQHCGLGEDKKFLLAGGSWGASMILNYTAEHPEHVMGHILRGTPLGAASSSTKLYASDAEGNSQLQLTGALSADQWNNVAAMWSEFAGFVERNRSLLPEADRDTAMGNLVRSYYQLMNDGIPENVRKHAAARWYAWEEFGGNPSKLATHEMVQHRITELAYGDEALRYFKGSRIENYYMHQRLLGNPEFYAEAGNPGYSFAAEQGNVDTYSKIPQYYVHGCDDEVASLEFVRPKLIDRITTCWEKRGKLGFPRAPHAPDLKVVKAGHAGSQPQIVKQFVRFTDHIADQIEKYGEIREATAPAPDAQRSTRFSEEAPGTAKTV